MMPADHESSRTMGGWRRLAVGARSDQGSWRREEGGGWRDSHRYLPFYLCQSHSSTGTRSLLRAPSLFEVRISNRDSYAVRSSDLSSCRDWVCRDSGSFANRAHSSLTSPLKMIPKQSGDARLEPSVLQVVAPTDMPGRYRFVVDHEGVAREVEVVGAVKFASNGCLLLSLTQATASGGGSTRRHFHCNCGC